MSEAGTFTTSDGCTIPWRSDGPAGETTICPLALDVLELLDALEIIPGADFTKIESAARFNALAVQFRAAPQ